MLKLVIIHNLNLESRVSFQTVLLDVLYEVWAGRVQVLEIGIQGRNGRIELLKLPGGIEVAQDLFHPQQIFFPVEKTRYNLSSELELDI